MTCVVRSRHADRRSDGPVEGVMGVRNGLRAWLSWAQRAGEIGINPLESVVLGAGKCGEDFDALQQVLIRDRRRYQSSQARCPPRARRLGTRYQGRSS